MTVKSADKKPEKYVGPDGKPKIRMVSVDKEVVKSEASDGKSFKEFREANTPVGQRDKMKIIDRKPHPDGGHIVTMQTKAGKTIKRHLKNGKVKDMTEAVKKGTHISDDPKAQERIEKFFKGLKHQPKGKDMKDMFGFMMKQMGYNPKTGLKEAVSKLPGGNKHLATAGTKATIMHPVTRVSKKVDKKDLKKHVDAGWKHMGQKRNRVEDTDEGYASDAQRKAVWASKNEEVEELGENDGYYAYQNAKDKYHKDNPGSDFERAPEHHKQKYIHPEMKKRGYVKSGSRWVKEEAELDEVATPAMKKAGTELNAYAKKSGGIDKADFMKAADMLSSGKAGMAFIKFVNGQDTEVFEKIISVMSKHMGRQTVEKMFKVRVREEVNEVLDTPKAMQSYKDKAKYSRDRASGSAAAKILSKGALGSHKPELDTMRKRHKGMDMVDRNAKKKTFNALRGNK